MIYILLPVFNEELNISEVIIRISKVLSNSDYKISVINDGSTDRSYDIINELSKRIPVEIISHKTNLGLGVALKTGFENLINNIGINDIIITMDSDNSHPPEIILEMINEINRGNDIVIASRYCPGGKEVGLKLRRRILSRIVNILLKMCFYDKNAKDYTCGLGVIGTTAGFIPSLVSVLLISTGFFSSFASFFGFSFSVIPFCSCLDSSEKISATSCSVVET